MNWLDAHDVEYEVLDVMSSDTAYDEMVKLSGQELAPVIDVDGRILADFGPDQLEKFWKTLGAQNGWNWTEVNLKPRPRLPEWLRIKLPTTDTFSHTRGLLDELKLHTVCESAKMPKPLGMLEQGNNFFNDRRRPLHAEPVVSAPWRQPNRGALEADEPDRVAEATRRMELRHVVITAVARDDLQDGGAEHFSRTVEAVRAANPGIVIEVLTPDFLDKDDAIDAVLAARPHIFNHNLETVRRLTPSVRSRATYERSLSVLGKVKARCGETIYTKSGLMLGLGETPEELFTAIDGLAPCEAATSLPWANICNQTLKHLPESVRFVPPQKFAG